VRDITGFALLLIAVVLLLYLLVQVVLPFVVTYLAGLALFYVGVAVLLRRGRLHPLHLPSLLNPGVGPAIAVLSVIIPLLHAAIFQLATASELWPVVLAVNGAPTVLWSAYLLRLHRREKVRYFSEGHDIEDLLTTAMAREAALEVRSDVLESASLEKHEPEPWERIAGADVASMADPGPLLAEPLQRIAELRKAYRPVIDDLRELLDSVRRWAQATATAGEVEAARAAVAGLDDRFRGVMESSEVALSRTVAGRLAGWEEEG
jgi:hypothetical protein